MRVGLRAGVVRVQVSAMTFGGETFVASRDDSRLTKQLHAVRDLMLDGRWRSLAQIEDAVKCPQASISARLRDLRKPKFGGYTVEREYVTRGLWRYRIAIANQQGRLLMN